MEKELIFIHVICGGIPVYFCSALQDCNEFGGTDTDSLKLAVDTAFDENNGLVKLPENTYKYCMISSTADGASINSVNIQDSYTAKRKSPMVNHHLLRCS